MVILEIKANGLNFNQECQFAVKLDGQIAERAANHVFGRDLGVLVIPKDVLKQIGNDYDRVGFIDIASLGRGQDWLKSLEGVPDSFRDSSRGCHCVTP